VRRSTVITLGASAAFGVIAIMLARGFINNAVNTQYEQSLTQVKAVPVKNIQTVPVLVADMPLKFGAQLSPQNLRLVNYPADAVPLGGYSSFEQLFTDPEQPPVVLMQMTENEPVLAFKVSGPGGRAALSSLIGENMRAVAIRVNDVSGVAGFVQPGDSVDVLLTREIETKKRGAAKDGGKLNYTTGLLVQKVRVLGTDQRTETQANDPKVVRTITLEVDHEQAQKLTLAQAVGELSLNLRRIGSSEQIMSRQTVLRDLTARGQKRPVRSVRRTNSPRVSAAPAPTGSTANVTIIRNGKSQQVNVFKEKQAEPGLAGGVQ